VFQVEQKLTVLPEVLGDQLEQEVLEEVLVVLEHLVLQLLCNMSEVSLETLRVEHTFQHIGIQTHQALLPEME
jgi:hypothetical protein